MSKIHNLKRLEKFRKKLRKSLTPAEAVLWNAIKNKQLEGRKFRRQHSIGNYIVDFYCPQEKLVIELDGAGHFTHEGNEKDEVRDNYLNSLGIRVIRFENKELYHNLEAVLKVISDNFKATAD